MGALTTDAPPSSSTGQEMNFAKIATLGVLLFSASASASAQQINSATDPALAGSTVADFEAAPAGTFTSLTVSGVTFTAAAGENFQISGAYAGQYNSRGAQSLQNQGYNFSNLTMNFGGNVSAFGFLFGASDNQWTVTAYDAFNNAIATVNAPITRSSNSGDFIGYKSGSADIAYATLSGPRSDYIFVDNVQYVATVATPEPASLALLGTGLLGVVGMVRRKRAT